jgi:hypothetical protein
MRGASKRDGDEAKVNWPGRVALLVLTFWALAMIVPGLQRVFDSIGAYGVSVDNDGLVTDVVAPFASAAESPAAAAGIVPGDRVDLKAMRCVPPGTRRCADLIAILGGMGGIQAALPGTEIALEILPVSGGPPKTVKFEAALAPLTLAARVVLLADTVVGMVVIAIAFWLVWMRPSWMTWGLFLYVIWFNPGQYYTFYAVLQRWPLGLAGQELIEAIGEGAAFAGLLLFALRFPEDRTEPRWEKVQWTVPLLGAAVTALTLLSFLGTVGYPAERITQIGFLAGLVIDAGVLYILIARSRAMPPREKQRIRWVIWGCAIGMPTYIFAELCQSTDLFNNLLGPVQSQVLTGLFYLPNGVLAYFAAHAVWQRRVVSVAIPLRRGTTLAALSFGAGVPIFLLHEKLGQAEERFHLPNWIWLLVVAPLILLLLHRLHEIAVEVVDHIFNRKFHKARKNLENATEEIRRAETLAQIDHLLVENAVRAFRLSSGAVFRYDGGVFRRTQNTKGWDASMKKELRRESDAVVLRSADIGEAMRLHHGQWAAPGLPTGVEEPALCVPVPSGMPEATAVILFGPHDTGNDIDADEREELEQFAERAAVGYERVVSGALRQEVAQLKAQLGAVRAGN